MAMEGFFPWQQDLARQWLLSQKDRFAHAWLIHGLAGIGKREFALSAAQSLLCESPNNGLACGKCLACGWVQHGNHPDFKRIRPEVVALEEGAEEASSESGEDTVQADSGSSSKRAPSKDIRIDQIRALEPWFNNATHRGGWRVALIYPSESLTVISANALLKVLEEPPPSTVFLLVADAPDRLLPTLLSRCRRLPLPTPSRDVAQQWLVSQGVKNPDLWLAASGGAPVLAKKLAGSGGDPCPDWLSEFIFNISKGNMPDIGRMADQISKLPTSDWIDHLQRMSIDAMMISSQLPARYFPSIQSQLSFVQNQKNCTELSDLSVWLDEQQRVSGHPLNPKLFAHTALQKVATGLMRLAAVRS